MTELSVLFVTYNSWRVCVEALHSLRAHAPKHVDGTPVSYEVIVVDNMSPTRDPEAEAELSKLVDEIGGKLIMHDENGGYSKGMNLAYKHCSGEYILVSNPDVLYQDGCIDALIRSLREDPSIGAAAPEGFWDRNMDCRLPPNILPTLVDLLELFMASLGPRFVRRYSRRRSERALKIWDAKADVDLDMLSGCCFLMQRSYIEEIGFFDERFPLYYEDTDLSVRILKSGRRVVQVFGSKLVHLYNRSGETDHRLAMERYWIGRRLYYRKWYGRLGEWVYLFTRKIQVTKWAKGRDQLVPNHGVIDLGSSHVRPVIRLPKPCDRFLVEITLDAKFYLAAGVFGSGDSWTPKRWLFANFGPTVYYFRVVDLTRPDHPEIGVYRHTLLAPTKYLSADELAELKAEKQRAQKAAEREPQTAEPQTAEPQTAEPQTAEPQTTESRENAEGDDGT